eukprot:m.33270 g.33270  ORF g.33270 m.33270 type:complete len:300 (+) comp7176_c0_seq1:824-1723(+)
MNVPSPPADSTASYPPSGGGSTLYSEARTTSVWTPASARESRRRARFRACTSCRVCIGPIADPRRCSTSANAASLGEIPLARLAAARRSASNRLVFFTTSTFLRLSGSGRPTTARAASFPTRRATVDAGSTGMPTRTPIAPVECAEWPSHRCALHWNDSIFHGFSPWILCSWKQKVLPAPRTGTPPPLPPISPAGTPDSAASCKRKKKLVSCLSVLRISESRLGAPILIPTSFGSPIIRSTSSRLPGGWTGQSPTAGRAMWTGSRLTTRRPGCRRSLGTMRSSWHPGRFGRQRLPRRAR